MAIVRCGQCEKEFSQNEVSVTTRGVLCDACKQNPDRTASDHPVQQATALRTAPVPAHHQFEFSGTGSEYFRIWIVNLFLSVVTLGIYSAWAKVRKNQYFYRNMRVAGSSFDYHGNPVAILKGRGIAVVLLLGFKYAPSIHMALYFAVLAIFLGVFPWLLARSFAFRLHNSSWRSIRFRFHGAVTQTAKVLYGYGILVPLSLGICYPLLYQRIRAFFYNNAAFGQTRARLRIGAGPVYSVFIRTAGVSLALFIVISIILSILFIITFIVDRTAARSIAGFHVGKFVLMSLPLYGFFFFTVYPFFQASMTNLLWNNIGLGSAAFKSTQGALRLAGILAGNAILTLVTLGFYWPWAAVKLARYRAETMILVAQDGLDDFAADAATYITAAGDEITSAFDVDISF